MMGHELRLVHAITSISDTLRSIDQSQVPVGLNLRTFLLHISCPLSTCPLHTFPLHVCIRDEHPLHTFPLYTALFTCALFTSALFTYALFISLLFTRAQFNPVLYAPAFFPHVLFTPTLPSSRAPLSPGARSATKCSGPHSRRLTTGAVVDSNHPTISPSSEGLAPRQAEAGANRKAVERGEEEPTTLPPPDPLPSLPSDACGGGASTQADGNASAPAPGGAWRPFVPLVAPGEPPHHLVRFFESEAFVLSTKERVPYLVFAEVILMEKPAPPVWSARKEFAAAAGRVVDAAADRSEFVASVQETSHLNGWRDAPATVLSIERDPGEQCCEGMTLAGGGQEGWLKLLVPSAGGEGRLLLTSASVRGAGRVTLSWCVKGSEERSGAYESSSGRSQRRVR
ncbi:MAG: hypothetical protein SGPRY_003398 [Prymnesium sp.]